MFLKRLYQQNKFLSIIVTTFLSAYIFLNIKWGMIATPVQQYGMFSGRYLSRDTLSIYLVKANGSFINNAKLSVMERDFMQAFPGYYESHQSKNEAVYNSLKKYLFFSTKEHRHRHKFFNSIDDRQFAGWYRERIAEITGEKADALELYKQRFYWNSQALFPIDTPQKIMFIGAR